MDALSPTLRRIAMLPAVRAVAVFDERAVRLSFHETASDERSVSDVLDAIAAHWTGTAAASSGRLLGRPFLCHPAGTALLILVGTSALDENDPDLWRFVQLAAREVSMRLFLRDTADESEPESKTWPSIARPPGY